ncbi:MAG: ketopantoate reductase family protein [Candidatus Aminicenantes bacterium]|nr:ketopantoate reductase family protein [Candidatus Aminicenantes bacterium]
MKQNKRSIVIVGAGAVGSALAMAFSHRADLDVIAIGRKSHVERIREAGLQVTGIRDETVFFSAQEGFPKSLSRALVIVAVKAYDLETTLESLRPALDASSVILLIQNGFGIRELAEKTLSGVVPMHHIVVGIVGMGVTFQGPGHIQFWGGNVRLEPVFADTEFRDVFDDTPVAGKISTCIQRDMWRKLVVNSIVNPLSVLLQTSNRLIAEPRLDELKQSLLNEGQAVAAAAGYDLGMDVAFFNRFIENDNYTSMYQDIAKRRMTEVDFINGGIVAAAESLGLDAPLNRWICHLIHAVEIARTEGRMRAFPGTASD